MFDIQENLKNLPDQPGVYLHKDRLGEVIYVGKAASLRSRVRQYFQSSRNMDAKVRAMVSHIAEFEYITTNTEMEALILENTLIKKHMPQYNVLLRDDKTYPYIKVTMAEDFPRLVKTRQVINDGSKYFGPYADVKSVNYIIDLLNDIYQLKRCPAVKFPSDHRPCLNCHINRCKGVCRGDVHRDTYLAAIDSVIAFLGGKNRKVNDDLKRRMEQAAEAMNFEEAAQFRDYLQAANSIIEKQRVVLLSAGDIDIVLATKGEKGAHAVVFFVRDGRLVGRESHHLSAAAEDKPVEIVSAFLKQYYDNQNNIPKEILVEEPLQDQQLIEDWLSSLRGSNVKIYVPQRGDKRGLLAMAKKDIQHTAKLLDEKAKNQREKEETLRTALAETLDIEPGDGEAPYRVEAYDISNINGVDSVGAMVVYAGSKPVRKDYRRFRIKTVEGADDYSSMQEVIYRRLRRYQNGDAGFSPLPDLIFLDGGLGHVNAVMQVLDGLKLGIPVAGMVKDDKHRTRGLIYRGQEVPLKEIPLLYHFVGTVQEEVHRFAVEYHRGRRGKALIQSALDDVPGIGEKRRNALLHHFGSLEGIKAADVAALAAVPGMNMAAAEKLKTHFEAREQERE